MTNSLFIIWKTIITRKLKASGKGLILLLLFSNTLMAQDYPYTINKYSFIAYDKNVIHFEGDSYQDYLDLFQKFSAMVLQGKTNLHIVHIGDSHIQADYFSGQFRTRLQTMDKGLQGSRGFVFPYRVAKSNNPPNYRVTYTGDWEHCRNVEKNKTCLLGLSGIEVTTHDSLVSLDFSLARKNYLAYDFNRIRIYYNFWEAPYVASFTNGQIEDPEIKVNAPGGFVEFSFPVYLDSVTITFSKIDTVDIPLILYGFSFENDNPGITYSTIGVNGADSRSFLRCRFFESQLKSLEPDWIIVSLGTNDAYARNFSKDVFYANMDTLIQKIRIAAPGVPILLTTPGDHYRRRRYVNYQVPVAGKVLYSLARKHNLAVWDLFEVMGGINSIRNWKYFGLTANDYLHFSKSGYELQGNLLFNAFLKSYEKSISRENEKPVAKP